MSIGRIVLVAALFLAVAGGEAAAQVRAERPNLVGAEILGRGLAVTFNVERFITPKVGLGLGIFGAGTSDGGFFMLPLYVSLAPGDVHSVYLSAGVTLIGGTDFGDLESAWLTTVSIGYQFHSDAGLFVRPLLTVLTDTDGGGSLLWPGVTIGGSF